MGKTRRTAAILIVISAAIIYFMPPVGPLDREAMRAAALVVFAIGFWATGALPEHLTSLFFILFAIISRVAPVGVVLSGFYSSAIWLVFGGIVLAGAVQKTGLGRRMAQWLLGSIVTSYVGVISGIVMLTMLFGFFIPSTMGRVVLLIPVVMAMADRLGFTEGSPGRDGMIMAAILACYVPSCAVLPANVPNMVAAGAAESLYNISFSYGYYFKLHFPVVGLMKGILIIFLTCLLFPDRPHSEPSKTEKKMAPFSRNERVLTVILFLTLLLWGIDYIHGVSPAWVALAAGLVCMLPFVGLFKGGDAGQTVNYSPFFYVAGVLGMGAVVNDTGLGDTIGRGIIALIGFEPGHDMRNFFSLVLFATALGPITTSPGVPAVLAPLSADLAAATGFPLLTVLMTQVIAFSTILLPYQVPPVVVGMQLGRVNMLKGTRLILALAGVSILLLLPLNYFWWSLLGLFTP